MTDGRPPCALGACQAAQRRALQVARVHVALPGRQWSRQVADSRTRGCARPPTGCRPVPRPQPSSVSAIGSSTMTCLPCGGGDGLRRVVRVRRGDVHGVHIGARAQSFAARVDLCAEVARRSRRSARPATARPGGRPSAATASIWPHVRATGGVARDTTNTTAPAPRTAALHERCRSET